MSDAKDFKFSLKVMINKHENKAVFAEAGSDFADVLLSFLSLPLGTIVRLFNKQYGDNAPVLGSLTTLYNGLSTLDIDNFWTQSGKQMLLNPRSSFESESRKLKLNIDDTSPTDFFKCGHAGCKRKRSPIVSTYSDSLRCECGNFLSHSMGMTLDCKANGGVFTGKYRSFLITDDLKIAPVAPGLMIQALISLGITISDGAELRNVTLGFNEILELLRGSLLSPTPLTDLVFPRRRGSNSNSDVVRGDLLHQTGQESSSNSKRMIVKALLRKPDDKLLCVLANDDFVDFLFSLLVIPLGGVEFLLGGKTPFKNIDNLYACVAKDKSLSSPDIRNRLMKPELPPNYLSKNQIFPLAEQMNPKVYYFESVTTPGSTTTLGTGSWMDFKDPKGDQGSYVKRQGVFTLFDDLTVTRVDSSSVTQNVDWSDTSQLRHLELHIGLKEALNILKTSLISTSALSDALINPTLRIAPGVHAIV